MKLSEAIILGDTLKKSDSGEWLAEDGSCGCAFGGALLAAGVAAQEFHRQFNGNTQTRTSYEAVSEIPCVRALWPWLTGEHLEEISDLYFRVDAHMKTIEDVAAYVRTVEPPETEALRPAEEKELVGA
jgi:hypothetical protein